MYILYNAYARILKYEVMAALAGNVNTNCCDIAKVGVKHRSIYQKNFKKYQRVNKKPLIKG